MLRHGEYVPKSRRIYRKSFIRVARTLSAAGINTNAAFARHFGVSDDTIANWRKLDLAFDSAILNGEDDLAAECTERMLKFSRDGSETATRYLLDRRAEAFKPKSAVDHTSNGETLSALLAQHGEMSDKEAVDKGLIIDEIEESESPGRSREYDDE